MQRSLWRGNLGKYDKINLTIYSSYFLHKDFKPNKIKTQCFKAE